MEPLWTRLTKSPSRKKGSDNLNPRTLRIRQYCHDILSHAKSKKELNFDDFCIAISELTKCLQEEHMDVYNDQRDGGADYFLSHGGLTAIGSRISEMPGSMMPTVGLLIQSIIDSGEHHLSADKDFINGTTSYLYGMLNTRLNRQQEDEFARLLFVLTSKIKAYPQTINLWFYEPEPTPGVSSIAGKGGEIPLKSLAENASVPSPPNKQQLENPLFYLLLDLVLHEGNVGQFARTGLLYLIELLSSSDGMQAWLLRSDLCSLMVSGLGALYSQANRAIVKLGGQRKFASEQAPIIALSGKPESIWGHEPLEIEIIEEQNAHIENFIGYLLFWQDMLSYSKSKQLTDTLLRYFQMLFVKQVLYPSIIETTDDDGDYSAGVLTTLKCILTTLDHNKLSQIIVCYLMGISKSLDNDNTELQESSTDLLIYSDGKPLLTLRDVILSSLKSRKNEQLVITAINLLSVLTQKYYPYLIGNMFSVNENDINLERSNSELTSKHISQNIRLLRNMNLDFLTKELSLQSYEDDVEVMIVTNDFMAPSTTTIIPDDTAKTPISLLTDCNIKLSYHSLNMEDNILKEIWDIFEGSYYTNDPQLNIALCGLMIDFGSIGWCNISSWLGSAEGSDISDHFTGLLKSLKTLDDEFQRCSVTITDFEQHLDQFYDALKDRESQLVKESDTLSGFTTPKNQEEDLYYKRATPSSLLKALSKIGLTRSPQPSAIDVKGIDQNTKVALPKDSNHEINRELRLCQLLGNIIILQEFIKQLQALLIVRSWLFDY